MHVSRLSALIGLLLASSTFAQPATAQSAITQSTKTRSAITVPEGYSAVPFLSAAPEREFTQAEQVLDDAQDYAAVLETNKGTLTVDLLEDEAPQTVNNFVFLALHHFYDGVVFHRVLDGFMAQTGDPTGTGTGGPGYAFDDEIGENSSFTEAGILAMANAGPDTNGSQFFITFEATPWLDGGYSIFGRVTQGQAVLPALERIDPASEGPEYAFPPSDSLTLIKEKGITLAGDGEMTLERYLTTKLGAMPRRGERFEIDGYTGLIGQDGAGKRLVGLYAKPDVLESVTIVQRAK